MEDYLKWKEGYWRDFLLKIPMPIKPNERILEIGCGPAGLFMMFPQNQMTAVDPLLKKYRQHLSPLEENKFSHVEFLEMPFEQFSDNEGFDAILCVNAINHVADLAACFDKIGGLMRPGARLIMTIDAHHWPLLKKVFRLIPGDILHPHQHSLADYGAFLTGVGCKLELTKVLKKSFIFDYCLIVATR